MIGKQRIWDDTPTARARLSNARHVPGYLYTSPEVYALDKKEIFMKEWLCVGRAEECNRRSGVSRRQR